MTTHRPDVQFIPAWDEYRAICSCGWTGGYFDRQGEAWEQAIAHAEDENGDVSP